MPIDRKQDIQSVEIPFIGAELTRLPLSSAFVPVNFLEKDQYFKNIIFWAEKNPETGQTFYAIESRPGSVLQLSPPAISGGNGVFFWDATQSIYSVNETSIFKDTTAILSNGVIPPATITFAKSQPSAPIQYLCICSENALFVVDTSNNVTVLQNIPIVSVSATNPAVITTSTDHNLQTGYRVVLRGVTGSTPDVNGTAYTVTRLSATTFSIPVNVTIAGSGGTLGDFPTNRGSIVYMDGYFFVIDSSGKIYNCAFNDPLDWSPNVRVLTAQMYSGRWSALARQNNFLLAFSDNTIQAFIDNANPQGSPLQNYESGLVQVGLRSNDIRTLVTNGSQITWVGTTSTGQRSVFVMEGLSGPKEISTQTVRNWLSDNTSAVRGFYIKLAGKELYLLFSQSSALQGIQVYDYGSKLWSIWTFPGSNITSMAFNSTGDTIYFQTSDTKIYRLSAAETTDKAPSASPIGQGTPFEMAVQTENIDFKTQIRKFVKRLEFKADKTSQSALVNISYTDDDYNTFSTPRTIDTSNFHTFLPLGGNFRRRAFKFSYTGAVRQRWFSFELFFRFGQS